MESEFEGLCILEGVIIIRISVANAGTRARLANSKPTNGFSKELKFIQSRDLGILA